MISSLFSCHFLLSNRLFSLHIPLVSAPKTESSICTVYLPNTGALALLDVKKRQDEEKMLLGADYQDYALVLAQPNGRPYERRQIDRTPESLIQEHSLKKVVKNSFSQ